jgi:hypothetical protein
MVLKMSALKNTLTINEEILHYFPHVTNHYLCLVKSTPSIKTRHAMRLLIIADSSANYHMFKVPEFYVILIPVSEKVLLGDGNCQDCYGLVE